MKCYTSPPVAGWASVLQRPALDLSQLEGPVTKIMDEVALRGDDALLDFTARFDGVRLAELLVSPQEIQLAHEQVALDLQTAIRIAADNIRQFHAAQQSATEIIETMPGVQCWRRSVGIEKVGLYIPGGTAPLFSTVLMLAIPAQLAGCRDIILCTPPAKDGTVHPAILFAAQLAGVSRIYRVGGSQAIAAMTFGTESIPKVDKIFGPGNTYVTVAKQLAQRHGLAIDMPAGPSEVMVCADDTAIPAFVAADLLSQAEHGHDSQVVLIAHSNTMAQAIMQAVDEQLASLPRRELAAKSIANSVAIVTQDQAELIQLINTYAPEHLILAMENAQDLIPDIVNAGSVFLGHYTPESVGDYASGTNHTLPTNGYARAYSGVSLDSFVKKITYQQLTPTGLATLGPHVATMAAAEQLDAHRLAVDIRLQALAGQVKAESINRLQRLVRPNIAQLKPYSSARSEFTGQAEVFLDANENPYETGLNRYPDPLAKAVKAKVSELKGISPQYIMFGNGSDEVIDLIFRIFCQPGRDKVITLPPTYGMYRVGADINQVEVVEVPLLPGFKPDVAAIQRITDTHTKVLWLCTPNNPSGNDLPAQDIEQLVANFPGIVVIDEAYIDYANRSSYLDWLDRFPNLIIMQTFSKAWGLAGIRLGMAFAAPWIIDMLNATKPPYNINRLTQQAALDALNQVEEQQRQVQETLRERTQLVKQLQALSIVQQVYPSQANFLLVKVTDSQALYRYLVSRGIIVRDRSKQYLCEGCLRFTIGTPTENQHLLAAIQTYKEHAQA